MKNKKVLEVIFDPYFKKEFKKIKDSSLKERIIKQIQKIKENPQIGKPMRYSRKGTKEGYIPPFRLSCRVKGSIIYILDLSHKDEQ